jgi:hypothetical protein
MNSDPTLITLFLEGLDLIGVSRDRLVLRLQIHENADEVAARQWWAQHTGIPLEQFRRSTMKKHNPKTVRHNVGDGYRGCLSISVLQGRQLYDVLAGLVAGLAAMPRVTDEWHDEASAELDHSSGVTPSALV